MVSLLQIFLLTFHVHFSSLVIFNERPLKQNSKQINQFSGKWQTPETNHQRTYKNTQTYMFKKAWLTGKMKVIHNENWSLFAGNLFIDM
jgi:hypothetical protein